MLFTDDNNNNTPYDHQESNNPNHQRIRKSRPQPPPPAERKHFPWLRWPMRSALHATLRRRSSKIGNNDEMGDFFFCSTYSQVDVITSRILRVDTIKNFFFYSSKQCSAAMIVTVHSATMICS